MKIKLVLLLAACWCVVLSGCSTRVTSYELNKANETCKAKGGVFMLHSNTDGSVGVRCNDGHFQWVTQ